MTTFSATTHKHRNDVKVDFWHNIAESEYSQCFTGNLYSWLLNNLELQSTTTTHLLFQDDDYGKYTCIAANALGRDAESMYLYRKCHNIKSTTQTLKYPRTDEYTLTLSLYRIILKTNFRRSHRVWNMETNSSSPSVLSFSLCKCCHLGQMCTKPQCASFELITHNK